MANAYRALLALLPARPLQVGTVRALDYGVATIELPGGGLARARGDAAPGQRVFFRDELIEGPAPDLPYLELEV